MNIHLASILVFSCVPYATRVLTHGRMAKSVKPHCPALDLVAVPPYPKDHLSVPRQGTSKSCCPAIERGTGIIQKLEVLHGGSVDCRMHVHPSIHPFIQLAI
jgi:hypothetical protein